MHEMTPQSKREIAKASRICFQRAVDITQNDPRKTGKHNADTETWDLQFVIGKVSLGSQVPPFLWHHFCLVASKVPPSL